MFSGRTYSKVSQFAQLLNFQILSSAEFYRIQYAYQFPIIDDAWMIHQETILTILEDTPLKLSGEDICDSPIYSAKYCSYTIIDQKSGVIVDFELDQCSEVSSSYSMEKGGLERSLKKASTKSCGNLLNWTSSITNHLWWNAATCNHDPVLLAEKWTSIIHHIVNAHSWTENENFHRCAHPALSNDQQRKNYGFR